MAVDVVPAADSANGGGGAATAAFPVSTLVPASAVCIAASAYVSTQLSYYATFAVSLSCFARAVWPDRVGGALAIVDAYARQMVSLARADLEDDLWRLGDAARRAHPATATLGAAVAGWADRARRRAVAKWEENRDGARAAWFVLRLAARVVRLAATVLFDAAYDEARAWAPSVLGYLRAMFDGTGVRSPSCKKGDGFVLKDIVCLVGTGFYLLFTLHLLFSSTTASGMQLCAAFFAATCALTMLMAGIDRPDDTDKTGSTTTDDSSSGYAGEASRDEELEVRESWRFLWLLILVAYCIDALLLRVTLGPQPTALAVLALCNFGVLNAGRQVQVQLTTPDDEGEGAESSAEGVKGAVNKWRSGAMVVMAASSLKIFVIYLVLDCYLAALSSFWLFIMAELLLAEEDDLSYFDASSEDGEEGAGVEGDITGGAEEEADEVDREEHSNTSPSYDEEEGSTLEENCDSSAEYENVEEQRQEEPDCSDGGSEQPDCSDVSDGGSTDEEQPDCSDGGSTDDGWDLVEVDPEMPIKANCVHNRKSRYFRFPWKHIA